MKAKNVKKSDDLFDLSEVAAYFGISESTVRRKVRKSRENGVGFPIPLLSARSRLLWRKSDILDFKGEDAETIDFNPSMVPVMPQAPTLPSSEQVRRGLERHGIILPRYSGAVKEKARQVTGECRVADCCIPVGGEYAEPTL